MLSDVYDPLPKLLDWLKVINEGDLPAGIEMDYERTIIRWECRATSEDRLLVSVLDDLEFYFIVSSPEGFEALVRTMRTTRNPSHLAAPLPYM